MKGHLSIFFPARGKITQAESVENQTFNPIDKIVELYERLLKAEQEKVAMLHEIIKDK